MLWCRVAPRSGLAVKHFIDTGAGVIDEDYRGEVMVLLFNHGDKEFPGVWVGVGVGRWVGPCVCARARAVACWQPPLPCACTACQGLRDTPPPSRTCAPHHAPPLLHRPPPPPHGLCTHTHAVAQGDRIAQLVLERIATPEVAEVAALDATDRGAGGFGSTGVAAP